MKRAIDVSARVRHHVDTSDMKLGAFGVVPARGLATTPGGKRPLGRNRPRSRKAPIQAPPATRNAYIRIRSAICTALRAAPFSN
jgi:hypothetical protein